MNPPHLCQLLNGRSDLGTLAQVSKTQGEQYVCSDFGTTMKERRKPKKNPEKMSKTTWFFTEEKGKNPINASKGLKEGPYISLITKHREASLSAFQFPGNI